VYHYNVGASCNNCDIEVLDLLTPRFDVERFGAILVASARHADCLLCSGAVNRKALPRLLRVWEQCAKPCAIVAIGSCALGQGIFRGSCGTAEPVDHYLPVTAYVAGCPPKPEAILLGVVTALEQVKKMGKKS
jgi:Ni,Fe-hydrogenase III small subunit